MPKEDRDGFGKDGKGAKDADRLPPPPPRADFPKVPEPEKWVAVPVTPELPRAIAHPPEAEPVADIPEVKAELVEEAKPDPRALFEKPAKKIPKRPKARGLVNRGGLTNGGGGPEDLRSPAVRACGTAGASPTETA